jgi:uncharacterized protein
VKFQPDRAEGVNLISRFGAGRVRVNANDYASSVLVPWRGGVELWHVDAFEQLTAAHFDATLAFAPEIVIFGSGERLRFASPALYKGLIERRIGIETMDSAAACRTYNVLASEGRSVVMALLIEMPAEMPAG